MIADSSEIQSILDTATTMLQQLDGQVLDVLAVSKPPDKVLLLRLTPRLLFKHL